MAKQQANSKHEPVSPTNFYESLVENKGNAIALLSLICIITYGQTFFFNLTQYDDDYLITKNLGFLSYVSNIGQIFHMPYFDYYYRPLVMLSFMFDVQVGGTGPVFFHITNVLIHIITCCLVFLMLNKIETLRRYSFAGAVLFAVLPILSQAIAWIPGRNDSLATLFIMASLVVLIWFAEKRTWQYYLAHLTFFFCALLTKEIALLLPPIAWVLVTKITQKKKDSRLLVSLIVGWVVMFALWFMLRSAAMETAQPRASIVSLPALLANLRVILELLGKTIIPIGLSAYASYSSLAVILGMFSLIAIFLLTIQKKDSIDRTTVWFGMAWFIIFLLPSLAVTIYDSSHRFDYIESRAYLPVIGIIIVAAELVRAWKVKLDQRTLIIFSSIVLIFGAVTVVHSMNFKNPLTLWTHVTRSSPTSAEGFFQLGTIYEDSSALPQAESCYAAAVKLDPNNNGYHNNLGSVYAKLGKFPQATREFTTSIAIDSLNPYPYHNLGSIYYLSRNYPQAEKYWKQAIELQPDVSDPYVKLIKLYIMQNRGEEALYYSDLLKKKGLDIVAQVQAALKQAAANDSTK